MCVGVCVCLSARARARVMLRPGFWAQPRRPSWSTLRAENACFRGKAGALTCGSCVVCVYLCASERKGGREGGRGRGREGGSEGAREGERERERRERERAPTRGSHTHAHTHLHPRPMSTTIIRASHTDPQKSPPHGGGSGPFPPIGTSCLKVRDKSPSSCSRERMHMRRAMRVGASSQLWPRSSMSS